MIAAMRVVDATEIGGGPEVNGRTPAMRLFALLEVIASRDRSFSLQDLVEETGLPKPTVHRMLQQLEAEGLVQREDDGRQYGTGVRLRRLAESVLLNDGLHPDPDYRLPVPALLLVGADDKVGDIAGGSREWAARDARVEHVVIPGAAHASNQDNPAAFTAALVAFLDRVVPAPRPGVLACVREALRRV